MNKSLFSRIIKAWLIVGTLDITAASIQFYIKTGRGPVPIFKYIAGAVFPEASKGGTEMIIAGLVFHYIIALLVTVFFFLVFSKIAIPLVNRFFIGAIYGAFVWFVTTRVVVPLSLIGVRPSNPTNEIIAASILMVCIGIPLALMVPRPATSS
jgi:hypothetical protein